MRIDIVLLDMGGVLVDLGTPAADMALPMTEAQFWSVWLGSDSVAGYETGAHDLSVFCAQMGTELGLGPGEFTPARFARWRLPLFPRVAEVLPGLANTRTLALLSNTNPVHWQTVNAQSEAFRAFDRVFLSYEIGMHKPDPGFFAHALEALGADPERVLFVDDSEKNVAAARRLGINAHRAVGFDEACRVIRRHQERPAAR